MMFIDEKDQVDVAEGREGEEEVVEEVIGGVESPPGEPLESSEEPPSATGVGEGLARMFSSMLVPEKEQASYKKFVVPLLEFVEFDQALGTTGAAQLPAPMRVGIGFAALIGVGLFFRRQADGGKRGKKRGKKHSYSWSPGFGQVPPDGADSVADDQRYYPYQYVQGSGPSENVPPYPDVSVDITDEPDRAGEASQSK